MSPGPLASAPLRLLAALAPFGPRPWPHWRQVVVAALVAAGRSGSDCISWRAPAPPETTLAIARLSAEWGADASRRMFWFLQSQAAVGIVLAMSVALAAHNPNPALRIQDIAGLLVLAAAVIGESVADAQLRQFQGQPPNRNAMCDVGLWRWSRHPNYFFEWLAWLAYPVIAIDFSGIQSLRLARAARAGLHVLGAGPRLRHSAAGKHMLRTRGDAFRAYQQRTRPFLPFPTFRRP